MLYDDYVVIVPINGNRVLIQRQYKQGARRYCHGFPAGFKKKNESSLKAAKRELYEETGYKAKQWKKIGSYYDNVSISSAKFTIYCANELSKVGFDDNPDKTESKIKNTWINASKISTISMVGACMALSKEYLLKMF